MENNKSVNLEVVLWEGADMLRGNLDASEYKQVFLGLIFLKYISERFEHRYAQLEEENQGFETNIDEYTSFGVYFVPPDARWNSIVEHCESNDIGIYIDNAIQSIEHTNPELKGILPRYYARAELDKDRLSKLVKLFDTQIDTKADPDAFGKIYEYCLSKFAEKEGRRAGEFYTPAAVADVLVQAVDAKYGRVYDPCCGSGGMLIRAAKRINGKNNKGDLAFYGQESNPTTWKMCMMNLAIHGIEADIGRYNADVFLQDLHSELKADYILASPPFNMSEWGAERLWDDARWQYGMPPAGNANYAWLQHMIFHLSSKGRMGVVLSNGTLSTQTGGEGEIRRNIVESDIIECIISMPSNLFYNTAIPVSLWLINKGKQNYQKGKILFIDARSAFESAGRVKKGLTTEQITRIFETVHAYRENREYLDEVGFCAVADINKIRQCDYELVPGRYVGIPDILTDTEESQNSLEQLAKELKDLLHENHRLERELEEVLGEIGYEI